MSRLRSILVAFCAPLVACSGAGDSPGGKARYERPELSLVIPRDLPIPELVESYRVTPELTGWEVESPRSRVIESTNGPALKLIGRDGGRHELRIGCDVEYEAFNQVLVRGRYGGRLGVELRLMQGEEAVFTEKRMLNTAGGPKAATFERPWNAKALGPLTAIEIEVEGKGGAEIHSIDLVRTPIALWLPLPEKGPMTVALGNESRAGVGLAVGAPLMCEFDVERAGEKFSFACGQPGFLNTGGDRTVRVSLYAADGSTEPLKRRKVELESSRRDQPEWHDVTLSLSDYVGQRLRAQFELLAEKDLPTACAIATVEVYAPGTPTPTVLFVTSDTHRADHLGAAGSGVEVKTPAIDALAARGVLFEDAWASTNITSPSHTALMTGLHPRDTRLVANTGRLGGEAETLAEAFRDAGWATAGVVSVRHLGPRGIGLGQGFDRMRDPQGAPWDAEDAVDALLEYVDGAVGRPLFLWLHIFDAHDPYAPPKSHDRFYYPKKKNPFDPELPDPGFVEGTLPEHLNTLRDPEFAMAQYRAEVTYLDSELARLFEHPRVGSGWIAVTSDHGETLQGAGTWFNHSTLFPTTLRIPLVIAGPDVPAGVRVSSPADQVGLGRTLLDLAGLGFVEFPGENILGLIDDPASGSAPRFALSAGGSSASLMVDSWFAVLLLRDHSTLRPQDHERHDLELFDVSEDPECAADVEEDHPEVAREMRSQLVQWLGAASASGLARSRAVSEQSLRDLAALGYAGDTPEVGARVWIDPQCDCEQCARYR